MSDINLIIRYDNGNLEVVAQEAEKRLGKVGEKSGLKAGSLFSNAFSVGSKGLVGAVGALAGLTVKAFTAVGVAGGVALTKAIKDSSNVETVETQFRTLLKSGQRAQELVADLQDFGAKTPFELTGLSTATTQLLSFGIAQQDIIPTLQKLGDVSAGVGANIEDLTIPFGRLVSTQKLTLIELDKFADRGAITYQQLADKAGVSIQNIRNEITKGNIPFKVFTDVLNESTQEGGKFFNAMESRSKTLGGALSNLSDSFTALSSTVGKAFRPLVTRGVIALSNALDSVRNRAKDLNIFDDLILPLLRFREAMINNAVRPFEILYNIARAVGNGIIDFFRPLIDNFVITINKLIGVAQKVADFIGKTFNQAKIAVEDFFIEANKDRGSLFKGVLDDTSLTDKLLAQNQEAVNYVQNLKAEIAKEQADLIATTTDGTTVATQTITDQYTSLFSIFKEVGTSAITGVGNEFKNLEDRVRESNKVVGDFSKKIGQNLQKGIAGSAGSAFAEFGRALQSGNNALEAFGQAFLKAIGNVLIQQGTAFILEGTAYTFSANPALQAKGPGLIGAGSAMAVFGGLLGASVSPGKTGGGGGGGGGAGAGGLGFQDPVSGEFIGQVEGGAQPQTVLNINVEGNVVDQDAFTRRLVEQISEEGGRQGLVFDNFQTV